LADPSELIVISACKAYEDTLRPTHPVRFFSPLSLEKNAPSESSSRDVLLVQMISVSLL
jgi:hypothetical protein